MADEHNEVATPGGRIAPRLARIIADTLIHTRQRLAKTQSDVAHEVFTNATNHISDEVRAAMGPLFRRMANDPNVPKEIQPLLYHLGNSRGQAWAWIGGSATGAAMGGGLLDVLVNYLNPVTRPIIAANPAGILTPDTAAAAMVRGVTSVADSQREGAFGGIDAGRMDILAALAERYPTLTEILELLNRNQIQHTTAMHWLRRSGMSESGASAVLTLAKTPLTPEQAAAGWGRQLVTDQELLTVVESAGMGAREADVLKGLAGEPPPLETAILAWRRGIITEADVDRAIIQGPLRNEWIPAIKTLAEQPLPLEQAAIAVTQGHLTVERGQAAARLHGVNAEDFALITENAGRPPGLEFAAEAFHRGLITDDEWERMFLESSIKNRYIPAMRAMRERLIPQETVRLLYRNGLWDRDATLAELKGHGFTSERAQALIAFEDVRGTEGTKELTRSQIVDLYEEDLIDRAQALDMLSSVGFGDSEREWVIELAEVNKVRRFVNAAVSRVKSAYVMQRIPEAEAVHLLDQIGISSTQRDRLLSLWDLERDTVSAQLTTSQIQQALRAGLIDDMTAFSKLLGRGYAPDDAAILVTLAGGNPPTIEGSQQ